jgi:DnaK suppressor protein
MMPGEDGGMDHAEPDAFLAAELAGARATVADLQRELAGIAESTREVPDDEHDPEGSTIAYERARISALLIRAQQNVSDLLAARERVKNGTYRRCERCDAELPAERLAALPATRTCVACASAKSKW